MRLVVISSYCEDNKGEKVELVKTRINFKRLKPGDTGTYQKSFKIPAMPIQHLINWDKGLQSILIDGVDNFQFKNKTKK